jgi:hypothetical protein
LGSLSDDYETSINCYIYSKYHKKSDHIEHWYYWDLVNTDSKADSDQVKKNPIKALLGYKEKLEEDFNRYMKGFCFSNKEKVYRFVFDEKYLDKLHNLVYN